MLLEIRVRNLAVIDAVTTSFGPGLTVLTGETGAGKSILLDALGLALGSRADSGLVRSGAEGAAVSAEHQDRAVAGALGDLEPAGAERQLAGRGRVGDAVGRVAESRGAGRIDGAGRVADHADAEHHSAGDSDQPCVESIAVLEADRIRR